MIRTTILALIAALLVTATTSASDSRRVAAPPPGTAISDVPAHYSPNGVNRLRISSSNHSTFEGAHQRETVWKWTDDRGYAYTLTRVKLSLPSGTTTRYTLDHITPPAPVVNGNGERKVSPPPAGTDDRDIPAHYSRNGVKNLRVISNVGRTADAIITATVWNWTNNQGDTFKLTRRVTSREGGAVGNLGEFTLQRTASARPAPTPIPTPIPTPLPTPLPNPGKLRVPPTNLSDSEIPGFYSPQGVREMTIISNVGTDSAGGEVVETTWRWKDPAGVSYRLSRKKTRSSASYSLTKDR